MKHLAILVRIEGVGLLDRIQTVIYNVNVINPVRYNLSKLWCLWWNWLYTSRCEREPFMVCGFESRQAPCLIEPKMLVIFHWETSPTLINCSINLWRKMDRYCHIYNESKHVLAMLNHLIFSTEPHHPSHYMATSGSIGYRMIKFTGSKKIRLQNM